MGSEQRSVGDKFKGGQRGVAVSGGSGLGNEAARIRCNHWPMPRFAKPLQMRT
jgi:hypothetical protein